LIFLALPSLGDRKQSIKTAKNNPDQSIMPHDVGGWLPSNPAVLQSWIAQKVQSVKYKSTEDISPAVAEFRKMVVNNPALYMLFSEMLVEVPAKYQFDPSRSSEIRDVDTLFAVLDEIIHQPPSWNPSAQFGVPMIAVLAWPHGHQSRVRRLSE
jgi:phosphatidylserine decarboxylase